MSLRLGIATYRDTTMVAAPRANPRSSTASRALEAEELLLGAVLFDPCSWSSVADAVSEPDFAHVPHRLIMSAMRHLASRGHAPDRLAVEDYLGRRNELDVVGGAEYLAQLVRYTSSAANVANYARLVRDNSTRKKLRDLGERIAHDSGHAEIEDLVGTAQRILAALPPSGVTYALPLATLSDFVVPPRGRWLVSDLLPPDSLVMVFGPPKSGKTFAVTDLAMHAAHGLDWHGHSIRNPLRVAILAGEGRSGLRLRLHAWMAHHAGVERRGDVRLLPEAFSLPDRVADVINVLESYHPDVVIVDTLNAYFGLGDENSTQDMTRFVSTLRAVRDVVCCCVIVLHHTSVAETGRERGSGALRGAADVVIQVAKDQDDARLVGFQVVTGRDMDAWDMPLAFRLRQVQTDWLDEDGGAMTTCVVEPADSPVTLPGRQRRLTGNQRITVEVVNALARDKANGASKVRIKRREIVEKAMEHRVSQATAYRNLDRLAARMGWRFVDPSLLEVTVR